MEKVIETESNIIKRIGEKLLTIHEHVKKNYKRLSKVVIEQIQPRKRKKGQF